MPRFVPIGSTSMDRQGVLYCHGVEARCKVMTSGMVVLEIPWGISHGGYQLYQPPLGCQDFWLPSTTYDNHRKVMS